MVIGPPHRRDRGASPAGPAPPARRLRVRSCLLAHRGESGVAELVVILPVAMVAVLLILQAALWAHAAQVAQMAASVGDQAARAAGTPPGAGVARAEEVLSSLGGGVLVSPQVSTSVESGDVVMVRVTARAESVLPEFHLPVSARALGPAQLYRASG